MAGTKKSDLLRDVRVIIGENEHIDPLISADDELHVMDDMALERDTLLSTLIAPAIDKVHKLATPNMLRGITDEMADVEWHTDDNYCQWCTLDDDILFVTYVKISGWDRPVLTFIEDLGQDYDMCRAAYCGIRPTEQYPACAILPDIYGSMRLEAYPKETGDNVLRVLRCVKKAKESIGDDGATAEYAIGDGCYWSVVYTIASLYYLSVDDINKAQSMAAEAAEHLKIDR